MANIIGLLTLNDKQILEVDGDPSAGGGTAAPIGSIALANISGVGTFYVKQSVTDNDWANVSAGSGTTIGNPVSGATDWANLSIDGSGNLTDGFTLTTPSGASALDWSNGVTLYTPLNLSVTGTSTLDDGAITTDGGGNIVADSYTGSGAGLSGSAPSLNVGSAGTAGYASSADFASYATQLDGSYGVILGTESIMIGGTTIADNGAGGLGISFDSGTITTDGSGNLTVNGNVNIAGTTYVWPTSNTAGYLADDGSGNLSWSTVTASPGGSSEDVQWNNGGVLSGNGGVYMDGTGDLGLNGTLYADNGIVIVGHTSLDSGSITTNGSGNLTINGTVNIAGVSYIWPTSNVAGVLTDDGSGNLSWVSSSSSSPWQQTGGIGTAITQVDSTAPVQIATSIAAANGFWQLNQDGSGQVSNTEISWDDGGNLSSIAFNTGTLTVGGGGAQFSGSVMFAQTEFYNTMYINTNQAFQSGSYIDDASFRNSIDPNNRVLIANDGSTDVLNWSNTSNLSLGSSGGTVSSYSNAWQLNDAGSAYFAGGVFTIDDGGDINTAGTLYVNQTGYFGQSLSAASGYFYTGLFSYGPFQMGNGNYIIDASNANSIYPTGRQLIWPDGSTPALDWSTQGIVSINGVSYVWPSSQGGGGTVLTDDGSGNLTWQAGAGPVDIGYHLNSGYPGCILFVDDAGNIAQAPSQLVWGDDGALQTQYIMLYDGIVNGSFNYIINTAAQQLVAGDGITVNMDWSSTAGVSFDQDMSVNNGNDIRFNGLGDANWRIGRDLSTFPGPYLSPNISTNTLQFVVGNGSGEGFVFGNNAGTQYLNLDSNANAWFGDNVSMIGDVLDQSGTPSIDPNNRVLIASDGSDTLNWETPGSVTVAGLLSATYLAGDGSAITNISATGLSIQVNSISAYQQRSGGLGVNYNGTTFTMGQLSVTGTGTTADYTSQYYGVINNNPSWYYNAPGYWFLYYSSADNSWVLSQTQGATIASLAGQDYWSSAYLLYTYFPSGPSGYPPAVVASTGFSVDNGGNIITTGSIQSGATLILNDVYYNWTPTQGAADTYLQNDGTGNLSWVSATTTPGGSSGDVQWNNGGVLSGAGGVTMDGFGDLTLTGDLTVDSTAIINDGLDVSGVTTLDGGTISTNGSGNLFVENLTVDGEVLGALQIQSNLYVGSYIQTDGGLISSDGSGDLTLSGQITLGSGPNVVNINPTGTPQMSGSGWDFYNDGSAIFANDQFTISSSGNIGINSVYYLWPGTNNSGTLTNDGSGNLSWASQDLTIGEAIVGSTPYSILFVDEYGNLDQGSALVDSSGVSSVDFWLRLLVDITNTESLDWGNRLLMDNTATSSIDWANRRLVDPTGAVALSWFGGAPSLPDYSTVASPTEGMIAWNYTTHAQTSYNGTIWV